MKLTKNVIIILNTLLVILLCYCQITDVKLINRSAYINDENSNLLPLLIKEDDFPSDWTIDLEFTKQEYVSPDESNNHLVQTAMRYYIGSYGKRNIVIYHYIYEYETINDAQKRNDKLVEEMEDIYKEDQILSSVIDYYVEYFPMTKCKEEHNAIAYSCTTVVQKGSIINKFVIQGFRVESERDKEYTVYSSLSALYWWNNKFSQIYADS